MLRALALSVEPNSSNSLEPEIESCAGCLPPRLYKNLPHCSLFHTDQIEATRLIQLIASLQCSNHSITINRMSHKAFLVIVCNNAKSISTLMRFYPKQYKVDAVVLMQHTTVQTLTAVSCCLVCSDMLNQSWMVLILLVQQYLGQVEKLTCNFFLNLTPPAE